jgi:hypothetical protein
VPMNNLKAYNEYLYYEFCFDLDDEADESQICDNWPFSFTYRTNFNIRGNEIKILEFSDGEEDYYLIDGPVLGFYNKSGLSLDQLELQMLGDAWIGKQDTVDLDTSILGTYKIPSISERKARIYELCKQHLGNGDFEILIGLFIRNSGKYLTLVKNKKNAAIFIVGDKLVLRNIPFEHLDPWGRLTIGIGQLLKKGKIV